MRNAATRLSLITALVLWSPAAGEAQRPLVDPGTGAWELVSEDELAEVCRLDPDLLQQVTMRQDMSFAVASIWLEELETSSRAALTFLSKASHKASIWQARASRAAVSASASLAKRSCCCFNAYSQMVFLEV